MLWARRGLVGIAVVALGGVVVLAGAGCSQSRGRQRQEPGRLTSSSEARKLFGGRRTADVDTIVVVQMQFDVLRIEFPAEAIHHSEKTWNHVEELAGDPGRIALLRRNGFRMGTATADAWPGLRAIFEACEAKVTRGTQLVQSGAPLTLDLGPIEGSETVFMVTPDDRLVGQTFGGGAKYLHLDYAVEPDAGGRTTVRMTPEIHRQSDNKRWQSDGQGLAQVPEYEGKVFHRLSNSVGVAPGEFLVIGPDTGASSLSVGHCFLSRTIDGCKYETVLCITPQPFRTDTARR
jgi:hypothetical protein